MESLIKNNHCGLDKINHDYFLCRFHKVGFTYDYFIIDAKKLCFAPSMAMIFKRICMMHSLMVDFPYFLEVTHLEYVNCWPFC
jgi:hypothetical protein